MRLRLGLAALIATVLSGPAVARAAGGETGAVAIVDGTPIPSDVLDAAIQGQLMELRMREDQLRRGALEELIATVLVQREAEARGLSADELTRIEITDKAQVSPEEARSFYEANRARFGTTTEAEAIPQIVEGLGRQRQRERRAALAQELSAKYPVEVLLEPFRVAVDTGEAPLRGRPDAPVTIVEFSDFQCPFCVRARPAVNRVRQVYGDDVRFAFRHFPLSFHDQAPKAGEAVACAGEQGKFWEMHDRLWESAGQLQPADLKEHAAAVGLDAGAFAQCLDSSRNAAVVERDTEAGARLGVSGTPAFFINGRPLTGAQPFEAFAQVIEEELALARRATTEVATAP
ncbi:MAG: thioredoxin domain-containing protein [Acidobacteria bacterium]|jgi:predicted DsbA family dithiol-disulfide isomerase|nr:thioredoxin domain-containing protein [Acidobacteriota bacterium]